MAPGHAPQRTLLLLVAALTAGCGGGGGGSAGGNGPPPPPQEPPIFTTATAVRVTAATPFSATCLAVPAAATLYANAEVEPHLAIDPLNANHLVAAWQQDRMSDGGARGLVTAVSIDGGATWSSLQPSPFTQCAAGTLLRASDPWVAVSGAVVVQVGIAFTGAAHTPGARSTVLASRSVDGGTSWSPAITLADDDGSVHFNDKESVTIDATDPRYVYAVWDRLDQSDTGPTRLARSTDGGLSWSTATTIYDPGPGRQTIGNVAVTTPDGIVHVFFTELGPAAGNPQQTEAQLAVIRSVDKGLTWSAPVVIADLLPIAINPPSRPDLKVRAGEILGSFAADPVVGALYAVWQDARFTNGARNSIVLASSTDGGMSWTDPVRVNAEPSVPAFTPTLAVLPSGLVGVLYYDFRQTGTSTYQPTDLWLAVSRNRADWRETRVAGNFDLLDAPNAGGLFVGDYQGLTGDGSTFVALYSRTNRADASNPTDVFADRIDGSAVASGAADVGVSSGKATPRYLSVEARGRISRHLTDVREMRRAEWQRLLELSKQP
jgi:hypothetical protein